jgi:phosphoribosylformylglycinamidine cyclo-ligase
VRSLLPLLRKGAIKGLAHITGGGLLENIPRVLPGDAHAVIDADAWEQPRLMAFLQAQGAIEPEEMARTFNCGIGMAVVVAADRAETVAAALREAGETVHTIGHVEAGSRGCTVRGSTETWSARSDWTATHEA